MRAHKDFMFEDAANSAVIISESIAQELETLAGMQIDDTKVVSVSKAADEESVKGYLVIPQVDNISKSGRSRKDIRDLAGVTECRRTQIGDADVIYVCRGGIFFCSTLCDESTMSVG